MWDLVPVFAAGEVGAVVVVLVVAVGGGGDGVPVELGGGDCGEDRCGIANVGGGGGGKLIRGGNVGMGSVGWLQRAHVLVRLVFVVV